MSVRIGRFDFKGPYETTEELHDNPGVWTIISQFHGRTSILDVGYTSDVKAAAEAARRKLVDEVENNGGGKLVYAAYYTSPSMREMGHQVEEEIRTQFQVTGAR